MTNPNETNTRDSFIFYRSFYQSVRKLPAKDKAEIFDAICSYALDGEEIEMGIVPEAIFTVIQPNLDANRRKWENGCKAKAKKEPEDEQKISKPEAKDKQTRSKPEGNVDVNVNVDVDKDLDVNVYKDLAEGLSFILEEKLNRKLNNKSWSKEIKLLIEKDLVNRANAVEDVKRVIQEISNRFGEKYFPVIQSGASLREKFSKVESSMQRGSTRKLTKGEETIKAIYEDF
tara:strand:+ start:1223 stop:1912 length:690 start_codon:yes stop_codon:yes gene_type:complete